MTEKTRNGKWKVCIPLAGTDPACRKMTER